MDHRPTHGARPFQAASEFRSRLLACFPPVRVPADRIYVGSRERAEVDDEVQELCALTGGKSWVELDPSSLATLSEYLALMSDEAFVAYLPAFLEGALGWMEEGDEGTTGIVVSILCPLREDGQIHGFVMEHVVLSNRDQSRVIAEWLEEVEDR